MWFVCSSGLSCDQYSFLQECVMFYRKWRDSVMWRFLHAKHLLLWAGVRCCNNPGLSVSFRRINGRNITEIITFIPEKHLTPGQSISIRLETAVVTAERVFCARGARNTNTSYEVQHSECELTALPDTSQFVYQHRTFPKEQTNATLNSTEPILSYPMMTPNISSWCNLVLSCSFAGGDKTLGIATVGRDGDVRWPHQAL